MALRIPDVLRYEIGHRLESLRGTTGSEGLRGWINNRPGLAIGLAGVSLVLVALVLLLALRAPTPTPFQPGKMAWFYDVNTGKLFAGNPKKTGPIAAPSGPASEGGPAGFRAHVYSYALDPTEAELFTGFLERPDPDAETEPAASDMKDFQKWAQGRLIRRVKDNKWVRATSPEGQAILDEMLQPNKKGQTPIYQLPRQ